MDDNGVTVDIDADFVDRTSLDIKDMFDEVATKDTLRKIIENMSKQDVVSVIQETFSPYDLVYAEVDIDPEVEYRWV
jgi:hypothetical protein